MRAVTVKPNGGVHRWMMSVRLYRVAVFLLILSLSSLLIVHYYLYHMSGEKGSLVYRSRNQLAADDDPDSMKSYELQNLIEELKRVKASVNNELRTLEHKRQKLQAEVSTYQGQIDELKQGHDHFTKELQQVKMHVDQAKMEREEVALRSIPDIKAPRRILATEDDSIRISPLLSWKRCSMHTCFDYSRCSLLSGFPVYFYNPTIYSRTIGIVDAFIESSVIKYFGASTYITERPENACIYVVLVGELLDRTVDVDALSAALTRLPYWHGDGRNHVLVNLARTSHDRDVFGSVNTGRALVAQASFTTAGYRARFDVVIPPSLGPADGRVWHQLPPLSPVHRKYLLSFVGEYSVSHYDSAATTDDRNAFDKTMNNVQSSETPYRSRRGDTSNTTNIINRRDSDLSDNLYDSLRDGDIHKQRRLLETYNYATLEKDIVETLKRIALRSEENFLFQFACESIKQTGFPGEWGLCGTQQSRADLLRLSTFSLIIAPTNHSLVSSVVTQTRVYEAIQSGAVPIVLGDYITYPYSDILDWSRCLITLPKSRITELHFYVRSLTDTYISSMRRQCRMFFETYFGTTRSIMHTLLAILRTRLQIPPVPSPSEPSLTFYNSTNKPLTFPAHNLDSDTGDVLGPIEAPYASPKFLDNFTVNSDRFMQAGDPFQLYPYRPSLEVLPGEAQFLGSGVGFRPVNKGEGGSGKEFSEALGGNVPKEQFTIVMLTYKREVVLINALQRLKGLPHLNSVVVVWNSPDPPYVALRWPEINVPIHVVMGRGNSLNNRFLPYDVIDTEAILSVDDDAHLRHDEIIFGFRVWRENRDQIVGFPARYHTWDNAHKSWLYNSNYTCELSMVLTGAAFFHKYYGYIYSYLMSPEVRQKVDEYMNCEDIAMNFLVSHITRKPPIKVTSRWTFRCPGCNDALSIDDSHFHERHKCINFFVKVYGYMPLMYTQYRVDSVLFKTRISHDKQKCFKFI